MKICPARTRFRRSKLGTGPSTTHSRPFIRPTIAAVYLMTQRLLKHPYLAIFDGPDTNVSTEARPRSTVPLQALFLMNSPFVHEQSAGFARRLIASSADPVRRIELAYQLAWSRLPSPHETNRASGFCKNAGRRSTRRMHLANLASRKPGPAWPRSC